MIVMSNDTRHDPSGNDTRPDLFDLWRIHYFNTEDIATLAGVPEQTILAMLRFRPVPMGVAQRVLGIIESLFPGGYGLATVKVSILDSREAEEMDAADLAVIGRMLHETREYATCPVFKETLRQRLLQQAQARRRDAV
jgi:hypothetical protein